MYKYIDVYMYIHIHRYVYIYIYIDAYICLYPAAVKSGRQKGGCVGILITVLRKQMKATDHHRAAILTPEKNSHL